MKIFFDCEFTGLHQHTTLVSLGCVAENGEQFYAESRDYDHDQVTPWIEENVIKHLMLEDTYVASPHGVNLPVMTSQEGLWTIKGHNFQITRFFELWIKTMNFGQIEMWGDVLAWDWVLFCELFDMPANQDSAERLPRSIYYIPFDIATLMKIKDVNPDISREELAGETAYVKHNALDDARVVELCYKKLMEL